MKFQAFYFFLFFLLIKIFYISSISPDNDHFYLLSNNLMQVLNIRQGIIVENKNFKTNVVETFKKFSFKNIPIMIVDIEKLLKNMIKGNFPYANTLIIFKPEEFIKIVEFLQYLENVNKYLWVTNL